MLTEAREAPDAVARLMANDTDVVAALAADLRAHDPHALLTVARGSSDHAAQHMAYLVMARLGRLVTSLPMSLITLHVVKVWWLLRFHNPAKALTSLHRCSSSRLVAHAPWPL
jgi:glutamine---fructose-6-phosphate transaminase (isomerizing)